MKGLAQIYSSWITRFKVDGFRVDTAKHVNAAFFKLWVPRVRAAAKSAGVNDFPVFGEVTLNDAVDLAAYVRDRGLPQVLDFPFQQVATAYASGASGSRGVANRLKDDDYFRTPNGVDPSFTTFLGNHDMGRGAQQILQQAPGLSSSALLQHVLLGYDLLYLLRGAPALLYGDEVGMIGAGGDKNARQDMFPTQITDWQTEKRVGSGPIGNGSSFDVANPIEVHLKTLSKLRDDYPVLSTGASYVRYAQGSLLVVQRVDVATGQSVVVAFNNGDTSATTPLADAGRVVFGTGTLANGRLTMPPVSALVLAQQPLAPGTKTQVKLTAKPDDLTAYFALGATAGTQPASVTFAVRRTGGAWQRLAIDDSAPYRAFLDPTRFKKHEKVEGVAVSRGIGGTVSVSQIATFSPHG
jgi:glycosidase